MQAEDDLDLKVLDHPDQIPAVVIVDGQDLQIVDLVEEHQGNNMNLAQYVLL